MFIDNLQGKKVKNFHSYYGKYQTLKTTSKVSTELELEHFSTTQSKVVTMKNYKCIKRGKEYAS